MPIIAFGFGAPNVIRLLGLVAVFPTSPPPKPLTPSLLMLLLSHFSRVMDWSPPGSAAHGILQARMLEWAAMPSARGSSQPRD